MSIATEVYASLIIPADRLTASRTTQAISQKESEEMAIRTFMINKYTIKVGDKMSATFGATTIKARGIISCIGPDNHRVVAYFLSPDSPIPAPTTTIGGKWGPVFLSEELMDAWVDILRHETPLYGYINTDQPSWTSVSTTEEPVGEEES